MPRKCIPEHDLVRAPCALDLVPDHRRAARALGFRLGFAAGEHERPPCDEMRLLDELDLRAECDPAEAAAAMARRLAHQHHARAATTGIEIGFEVRKTPPRHLVARRAIARVRIAPRIEYARGFRRPFLEDPEEVRGVWHRAGF